MDKKNRNIGQSKGFTFSMEMSNIKSIALINFLSFDRMAAPPARGRYQITIYFPGCGVRVSVIASIETPDGFHCRSDTTI